MQHLSASRKRVLLIDRGCGPSSAAGLQKEFGGTCPALPVSFSYLQNKGDSSHLRGTVKYCVRRWLFCVGLLKQNMGAFIGSGLWHFFPKGPS